MLVKFSVIVWPAVADTTKSAVCFSLRSLSNPLNLNPWLLKLPDVTSSDIMSNAPPFVASGPKMSPLDIIGPTKSWHPTKSLPVNARSDM